MANHNPTPENAFNNIVFLVNNAKDDDSEEQESPAFTGHDSSDAAKTPVNDIAL